MAALDHGCSQRIALRLQQVARLSRGAHPAETPNWRQLDHDHRKGICTCLNLPGASSATRRWLRQGYGRLRGQRSSRPWAPSTSCRGLLEEAPYSSGCTPTSTRMMGHRLALDDQVVAPVD